ncbi:MAG: hypothetical protein IJJ28_06315, partial [Lentisphaeria bacterium]|nr:hypothetical protein [Lentisphaeria bacterium]
MFAAVHFAIIAVYTVKVERAVICCVLAALAFAGAVAAIQPRLVAFKFIALLALIVGVDLAIVRCKVLKHFGARRFLHGRWWRIVPVAVEFAAAAVLLALHLCSHLAAERFFDRLEREVGEFKNSDAAAVRLTIPAPKGSHLLLLSP